MVLLLPEILQRCMAEVFLASQVLYAADHPLA